MSLLKVTGTVPPFIIASAVAYNSSDLKSPVYVLSSSTARKNTDDLSFTDVYQLTLSDDLTSGDWRRLTSSSVVIPGTLRSQSALFMVNNLIYVYGGIETLTNLPMNDVWIYDIKSNKWFDNTAAK